MEEDVKRLPPKECLKLHEIRYIKGIHPLYLSGFFLWHHFATSCVFILTLRLEPNKVSKHMNESTV